MVPRSSFEVTQPRTIPLSWYPHIHLLWYLIIHTPSVGPTVISFVRPSVRPSLVHAAALQALLPTWTEWFDSFKGAPSLWALSHHHGVRQGMPWAPWPSGLELVQIKQASSVPVWTRFTTNGIHSLSMQWAPRKNISQWLWCSFRVRAPCPGKI